MPNQSFLLASQITGKEYCKLAKVVLPANAPLLIHHPSHLAAICTAINFLLLACYQCHDDIIVGYLEKSLLRFDKMKWVFREQWLNGNRVEMDHFNISKLHSLTHYSSWTQQMG
jgi:hypothetical protein